MKTVASLALFLLLLCCVSATNADTFGAAENIFDIEFVAIGNPGNAADTTGNPNSAGSVSYEYRIGKYEISREMIDNANAEGALGITLRDMTDLGGNEPEKPATGVSWFEAARFVNWLNTSTSNTPAYKFDSNGDFQLWQPGDDGYDPNNLYRNRLAVYFLPSADEWYKAAYHDATAGTAGLYFNYPTGSDSVPTAVTAGVAPDTAVYRQLTATGPAEITRAGGLSAYGTMGQGGNVLEWEETDHDLLNDSTTSNRGVRGGDWNNTSGSLSSSSRNRDRPDTKDDSGFRVASIIIPEPTSVTLALSVLLFLAVGRRQEH